MTTKAGMLTFIGLARDTRCLGAVSMVLLTHEANCIKSLVWKE